MTINMNKAIAWYQSNVGKHTYSMENPRFDCSYSVAAALSAAGAGGISPNAYNTVNLPALLDKLGFQRVYSGPTLRATGVLDGDVVLMSGGNSMADSAGDNGHTGIIGPNGKFYNTTATDWMNGKKFVAGNAVQIAPWMEYIKITRLKNHTEIWRLGKAVASKPAGKSKPAKLTVDSIFGVKSVQALEYLAGTGDDGVITDITPANAKYVPNLTSKRIGNQPSETVKWLQKQVGVDPDGFWGPATNIGIAHMCGATGGDERIFGPNEARGLQKWINFKLSY